MVSQNKKQLLLKMVLRNETAELVAPATLGAGYRLVAEVNGVIKTVVVVRWSRGSQHELLFTPILTCHLFAA